MLRKQKYPNIILIILDTARAQNFSCYGYQKATTPNIDAIAQEGALFLNAITPSPWTLPSHASMFTGMYPSGHGCHERHKFLNNNITTLPEVLKGVGYKTIGISNNSWVSSNFGFDKGFDNFIKLWQIIQYETDLADASAKGADKYWRAIGLITEGNLLVNMVNGFYGKLFWRKYDYGARRINRILKRLILNELKDVQPFFLFINYLEPHLKYCAPEPYYAQFLPNGINKRTARKVNQDAFRYIAGQVKMNIDDFEVLTALYDAELAYLDFRIGELYEYLKEKKLLDDTVLIITSDHGENLGEHNLMDHQYCLYDTLLKVPLIIRYPGVCSSGKVVSTQVQLVDIFPTVMDLLGLDDEGVLKSIQGQSLLPHRLSSQDRSYTVAEYVGPQPAIEVMARRYPGGEDHLSQFNRGLYAIRTSDWKYIESADGKDELYNIREDPGETKNRIGSQRVREVELKKKLKIWKENNKKTNADLSEKTIMNSEVMKRLESLGYLT